LTVEEEEKQAVACETRQQSLRATDKKNAGRDAGRYEQK